MRITPIAAGVEDHRPAEVGNWVTPSVTPAHESPPPAPSFEDLTPVNQLCESRRHGRHLVEALRIIGYMVMDAIVCVIVASLVNYGFTFGNILAHQSPAEQSYASFCAGVMGFTSLLLGSSMLIAQATSMLRLHFVDKPTQTAGLLRCVGKLVQQTWYMYVISLALVVGSAYGVARLPPETRPYKLHFYVSGLFVNFYTVCLDLAIRRIYQHQTVEGKTAHQPHRQVRTWKLLVRLAIRDNQVLFATYVAAIYIHVSSQLRLTSSASITVFASVSYAFKLSIQELVKAMIMHQRKTHTKTIYIAIAVPTVLIDTQIRVMLIRQTTVQQSVAGSIAIAVVECIFRFIKVWLVRAEIRSHTRRKLRNQSEHAKRDTTLGASNHQDDADLLSWRHRLLRFHAAEIHADMYAEYLAIGCSTSILYFFQTHPKYEWEKATMTNVRQQGLVLMGQLVMEIAVDIVSTVWELINGVPLRNSHKMRSFISALFLSTAITNIILSAAMYIRST